MTSQEGDSQLSILTGVSDKPSQSFIQKAHVPKLKFSIQGLGGGIPNGTQVELPQSLSQRRNSAIQSLFNTTTSISSVLQSARNPNMHTLQPMNTFDGQTVNLENTQELKAFATVDLVKINRDRQNQLKLALEDNLREKELEYEQIQNSNLQQKSEYERISETYQDQSQKLDHEIRQQKEYLANLKNDLSDMEQNYEEQYKQYEDFSERNGIQSQDTQEKIKHSQNEIQRIENDIQVLMVQRKGLQMGIEMQKKVRVQELDMKITPLKEEKEQFSMHLEMLQGNLNALRELQSQSDNEIQMIQEDLIVSESNGMDLVYQREEYEELIEKIKNQNYDLSFILKLTSNQPSLNWSQILQSLAQDKQKSLLIDLIRELQQYILGMSSNTTDNSVMQSEELEDIQYMIQQNKIQNSQAVELIVEFAQRKIQIQLNNEVLFQKLDNVFDLIEQDYLQQEVNNIKNIEEQMKNLDSRIKVISNRCQNELKPRLKALKQSDDKVQEEIKNANFNVNELEQYLQEVDKEILNIEVSFAETYQSNQEDLSEIEEKVEQLSEQIQNYEYQLDNLKQQLEDNEEINENLQQERNQREYEFEQYRQEFVLRQEQIKEEINKEKQAQKKQFGNTIIEELSVKVAQLKCDKESAQKRLRYIETKLQTSKESVQHAQQVLDNHILQSQQEQLNQKIQPTSQFQQKRFSQNTSQNAYGQTHSSRISNIQQNSSSLMHGQILSPSRDDAPKIPKRPQSSQKVASHHHQASDVNSNQERMHQHYIDPKQQSDIKKEPQRNYQSAHKSRMLPPTSQSQYGSQDQTQRINNDKSSIDVCKYYYDSTATISSQEDNNSYLNHQYQDFIKHKQTNNGNHKQIPINSLITPREILNEIQLNGQHNTHHNYIYESGPHISTITSSHNDSVCSSASNRYDQRKNSLQINESTSLQNIQNQSNSNHLLFKNQKVALRQSNSSYDGKQMKNVSIPLYSQFKENIMPPGIQQSFTCQNLNLSTTSSVTNQSSSGMNNFNLRKLSQATSISQLGGAGSNQSILSTLQSQSNGMMNNRPPAVPQSRNSSQYLNAGSQECGTPQSSNQKPQRAQVNQGNRSQQRNEGSLTKQVQTRMKINQNGNNGRVLQVGHVDLSKCNQNLKDLQFFESLKPLFEGAQFLVFRDHQFILKQVYLDFSLLRIYMINGYNGDKEMLMVENIIKPELPQSTLEQIRQEKNGNGQSNKKYEFNLIMNVGGVAQRMQLLAINYEELRLWIIGLNALIGNRNHLMRLASIISNN